MSVAGTTPRFSSLDHRVITFANGKEKAFGNSYSRVRKEQGQNGEPSAGIIDSQSVKTTGKTGKCTATMGKNKSKVESDIS